MQNTITLPCAIEQQLWCINDNNMVEEVQCLGFLATDGYLGVLYHERCADDVYNVAIGTYVFLTKDEAERKLRRDKIEKLRSIKNALRKSRKSDANNT